MVDETQYAILYEERSPLIPEETTLFVWQRNGNARIRMNRLEDMVIEPGNAWPTPVGDAVYTWEHFKLMIENEYGSLLQTALDNNPGDVAAALVEWLQPYFQAHNNPQNLLDGWEGQDFYYTAPEGEPMAGLLPPTE